MKRNPVLSEALWPSHRLGEALGLLVRQTGLRSAHPSVELSEPPQGSGDDEESSLTEWLQDSGARLGVDLIPASVMYPELPALLASPLPALARVPGSGEIAAGYALLVRGDRRRLWLLAPDCPQLRSFPTSAMADALLQPLAAPYQAQLEQLLVRAAVPAALREQTTRKLLNTWLRRTPVPSIYTLGLPTSASWPDLLRSSGIWRLLGSLIGGNFLTLILMVTGALILADSVLWGRPSWGWLFGWGLALLSQVPLDSRGLWLEGQLALRTSAALGQRLLGGTFLLPPQTVRSAGIGQFLGLVLESDTLGRLLLSGLPIVLTSGLELFVCWALLAAGRLFAPLTALTATAAILALVLWRYHHRLRFVIDRRLSLSAAMVERMLGHRTRLVQHPPEYWHRQEDALLSDYRSALLQADRFSVAILGVLPRCWLLVGLGALLPSLLNQPSTPEVALALGLVLWAQRALGRLSTAGLQLAEALLAYQRLRPLLEAASLPQQPGALLPSLSRATSLPGTSRTPLVELVGVSFCYPAHPVPVLDKVDFSVQRGERVLLEGPSGGGKSTMASLILGLESPTSGVVLLSGLDLTVLGLRRWRRRIAGAPQFHLNHVLSESLAFNLLMGRRWPATESDYREARQICRSLGLGPLLERMPGGLFQMVGDSGWQLSHGERSRVFLARALLQRAEVLLLDESFAAMDPETLRICLDFVWQRRETIIAIAHP